MSSATGAGLVIERDVMVPMRDGARLAADIYRPDDGAPRPVLLERLPYGKQYQAARLFLDPAFAASRGYAVVVQDCRGRFASEGDYYPFHQDRDDGYDTIEWAARQPWCSGKVGMFGGSGHGQTQWLAQMANPPALRAMAPIIAVSRPANAWIYRTGGAMALNSVIGWGLWMAVEVARRKGISHPVVDRVRELYEDCYTSDDPQAIVASRLAMKDMLNDIYRTCQPLAQFRQFDDTMPWLRDWVAHSNPDDAYWREVSFTAEHAACSDAAVLQVTGWYDYFMHDVLNSFTLMRSHARTEKARASQRLVIGPWPHDAIGPSTTRCGDMDFGAHAGIDLAAEQMRWFDRHLLGAGDTPASESPLRLFVMGANVWRDEWEWPLARTQWQRWYFDGSGHANSAAGDGVLSRERPLRSASDRYTYDPAHPVPTCGGVVQGSGLAHGIFDQREVEARPDVLVYTSAVLATDVEVTGPVKAELWISSSCVDTDFTAKLVDVHPDGRAMNLCEGIARTRWRGADGKAAGDLMPGERYALVIDLWATSNVFRAGHAIRLEISSSNFPHFAANPNTGDYHGFDASLKPCIAQQAVHHGPEHPSCIILPVIPASRN